MQQVTLTAVQIEELCQELAGTCGDIDAALEQITKCKLVDLDEESLQEIDDRIFQCAACSWWCNSDEQSNLIEDSDELICKACAAAV